MKKLLLTTVLVVFAIVGAKAVDIINTHFNTGEAWNYKNAISDCESKGDRANTEETTFTLDNFTFTVKDCGYAPTCNTKKTGAPADLTVGYVEINKTGYLTIPQQNSISTINMAISATGTSSRGIVVEKSVNGGDWSVVLDQKLTKDDAGIGSTDIQSGYVLPAITVNESNVAIRIYSGSYEQVLRIHDLRVQGDVTGITAVDASKTVKSVEYFDVLGRRTTGQADGLVIVKSTYNDGTTATKKIYKLD